MATVVILLRMHVTTCRHGKNKDEKQNDFAYVLYLFADR